VFLVKLSVMAPKTALVLIADGSEEMESVIPINVLRRADVEVTVALVKGTNDVALCSRGVKIVADAGLDEALKTSYDAIVLPGGLGGAETFAADPRVVALVKKQLASGALVAMICASPALVLPAAGVEGRRATCYPALNSRLGDKLTYVPDQNVVIDDNLLTSQGPGTAFDFALAIAKELMGEETYVSVKNAMLL